MTTTFPAPPMAPTVRSIDDAGFIGATLQVAKRTLRKFLRTPQLLVGSIAQGAMFLLIFRYVFGGAIGSNGVSYVDFLVPGFVATGVLFSGIGAAAGVAEDAQQGLADRLRSLPIPGAAVLAGRVLADTILLFVGIAVSVSIGFAIGFRLHTSAASGLGALALCVAIGFAFEWLFACVGMWAGNAQAAQSMSMFVFPLSFVSSAYVAVETMPGWLQVFAAHQPLTPMSDAVRALAIGAQPGQDTAHLVLMALIWCAAIIAVFAPLAVLRFRRP
jgi:ABC transporter DrrB family efflux protein